MKKSVVWADGTFESNTAPLMGPLEKCAVQAAEIGFDGMSLTVNRPEELDPVRINKIMGECGLAVSGLATGRAYTVDGLGLGMADGERRKAAVDRMLRHTELCAELGGAKLIIGAVRGWVKDAGNKRRYEELFRDSIEKILKRAQTLQVKVVIEAISRIDSDAYCSVEETAEFIRSVHSDTLQLQLDSIHLHTNGETGIYDKILHSADLLGQVDISDVGRKAPDGKHIDFQELIQGLKDAKYQEYLVFEYQMSPPEGAAKAGLEYIRTLL